ncbi:OmpA family protein [Acidipila sp. EB88]|nr:OmpA family protein [Acidipila sp. EB88]
MTYPLACVLVLGCVCGCSTKKYVRNQTAPVIQQTNELDDKTAANNRSLQDLDKRTGTGIANAQSSADSAQQSATGASTVANQAQQSAQDAVHRAGSLSSVVANLDTYSKVDDISLNFAFNKAELNRSAKAQLDELGQRLGSQRSYILQLTGGTDSVGSATYNYELSDKRADAVVQYLASRYGVPAHRFYLIGLGKDKAVASNNTAAGRALNRRVEVQLLSNQTSADATSNSSTGTAAGHP